MPRFRLRQTVITARTCEYIVEAESAAAARERVDVGTVRGRTVGQPARVHIGEPECEPYLGPLPPEADRDGCAG